MKILIAENDENICTLYKYALCDKHDLIICNTGENCIEQFNKYNSDNSNFERKLKNSIFDIVILDYQLPGIDGISVAKELIKKAPDQRIIFISAFSKSLLKNMIDAKKIEVIQKPFQISELIQLIEERKMHDELELLIKEEKNISSQDTISIEQTSNLFRILNELKQLNIKQDYEEA
jgi:DNA-binding response OmpR family regulator